jgi:acyl-CoA synthetase (AMP-forming)/AMP-acid ligase II
VNAEVDIRKLKAFCEGRIQKYMVPETITIVEELPKTSTGKLDRQALLRQHT